MRKINEINNIAIVGGGSSAWITAALLSHDLPFLNITIIDKEIGTPVGVGEGTLLSFDKIMSRCGFSIDEWFFEVDAAVKGGILFPGWGKNEADVWHPFLFPQSQWIKDTPVTSTFDAWAKHQEYDFNESAQAYHSVTLKHNSIDVDDLSGYAYHIDAGKLVKYIQKKLANRSNVKSIQSEVVNIIRNNETHNIEKLILKDNTEVTADLYVDCTGFNAILNHKPNKVTLEGRLFCDTAIAAHVPYENIEKEFRPYVISEQVDHGWVWNIPVQSRIGSGIVFNRSITDIEEAKEYFIKYWDNRITNDNLKVIDWTPFYNTNMWHENVVSIGLSGGFIEPLESTGLAMIIVGVEHLAFSITPKFYTPATVDYFNNLMSNYYEDAIDFVSMHYALPEKDTKFWNWVRNTFVKSEMQQYYETQLLKTTGDLPRAGTGYMFCGSNWVTWLIQMGYKVNPVIDGLTDKQSLDFLLHNKKLEEIRVSRSVSHIDYIKRLQSRKNWY
tara:strand:- start:5273 stop:6769 length:1497 start_codon:yes stop_codon:yes gene_type:complete